MKNKNQRSVFLAMALLVLLAWPGVLTSPLVTDLIYAKQEGVNNGEWSDSPFLIDLDASYDSTLSKEENETSVATEKLCEKFLERVDSYLKADSIREDFHEGKPTLLMVLTKILPKAFFGMEQINTTDIKDAVAEQFCKEIELQYYLEERMGSIARKIAKIWKAENVGEIVVNIQEIGIELTETIERLAKKVNETEEHYINELKSIYKAATVIGPQVKESIKAVGRIENEARKIRWALKSLGETTLRRCQKILQALENLINGTTPKEVDMKRMLRYTANLLQTSHSKLRESITSYETMRRELNGLVVNLNSHDQSLAKITEDAEKEYLVKRNKGIIKIVTAGVGTVASAIGTGIGLSDGQFGAEDIVGPSALVYGLYKVVADSVGMSNLNQFYSDMSAELFQYRKDLLKYVRSSSDLQVILTFEEKAAREWYDIVKEIQADFGEDLEILTEALDDKEYLEDLIDAKAIFGLLQESAHNFLGLLAEKEKRIKEIQILFQGGLGLSL